MNPHRSNTHARTLFSSRAVKTRARSMNRTWASPSPHAPGVLEAWREEERSSFPFHAYTRFQIAGGPGVDDTPRQLPNAWMNLAAIPFRIRSASERKGGRADVGSQPEVGCCNCLCTDHFCRGTCTGTAGHGEHGP